MSKHPTRTYCKHSRPVPYDHPNCRMPRHWKFTQGHRTTLSPLLLMRLEKPKIRSMVHMLLYECLFCSWRSSLRFAGGAMVLGKLLVPGRPTIWVLVGQWPTALAVGAGGGCLAIFTFLYPFSPLSPTFWETARYRLKYYLKGPLNPKQPTNQL